MTNHLTNQNSNFKYYDFQKFWKVFPVNRPFKEVMKNILFTLFSLFFNQWAIYQNWKYAGVFRGSSLKVWQRVYWKRILLGNYTKPLPQVTKTAPTFSSCEKLAIVIHVFYPEIFREIIMLLAQPVKVKVTLYLTGPENILQQARLLVPDFFEEVYYFPSSNRGRDILPFLNILPKVFQDGHQFVLKLHTKYSNHLNRKDHWRLDLLSKLIGEGQIDRAMEIFNQNSAIGMIGPAGNILSMQLYYAANGQRVHAMANKMGVDDEMLHDMDFVAGSMFYARSEVLAQVITLKLSSDDFEEEAGQNDGTMAHVVERLFAAALIKSNLYLADTNYDFKNPVITVSKVNHFIV
jgi:lipopolysaccharide biosynthesis protein